LGFWAGKKCHPYLWTSRHQRHHCTCNQSDAIQ
jgi:hypothetical protein